jgi:hypothetical protein
MTIIRKNVYEKRGKTFETNKEMLDKYTQMITTLTENLKLIIFKRGGGGHLPPLKYTIHHNSVTDFSKQTLIKACFS